MKHTRLYTFQLCLFPMTSNFTNYLSSKRAGKLYLAFRGVSFNSTTLPALESMIKDAIFLVVRDIIRNKIIPYNNW